MAISVGAYRDIIVNTLAGGTVELTEDQRKSLAEELANDPEKRGYAEAAGGDRLRLLCTPYVAANPVPQGRVPRGEWKPDELKNLLLQATTADGQTPVWLAIKALQSHTNPQVAAVAQLFPEVFTLKAISLTNPSVMAGINLFKQVGVITDSIYQEITTILDPNWQPEIELPARSDVVLGEGIVPTLEEMA